MSIKKEEKMNAYLYGYQDKLYINLTNLCSNNCDFCVRNTADGVGGHNLWLEKEPSAEEVIARLKELNLDKYREFVFCGFGEPLYAFERLVEIGVFLRRKGKKTRLNTNGQAELIIKPEIVECMDGISDDIDICRRIVRILRGAVDTVSISLNASNAERYDEICRCAFKDDGFYSMLKFAEECVGKIQRVILSVVDTIGAEEIEKCGKIAGKIGAELRVRKYSAG
jgi:MoaA/NifB/PqqE/SkfB family radical SAM enzyme